MSERIRQLEDALQALQSQVAPDDQHPLLRQELLLIKKSPELFGVDHHQAPTTSTIHDNQRRGEELHRAPSANSSREGTDEVWFFFSLAELSFTSLTRYTAVLGSIKLIYWIRA